MHFYYVFILAACLAKLILGGFDGYPLCQLNLIRLMISLYYGLSVNRHTSAWVMVLNSPGALTLPVAAPNAV